MVQRHQKTEKYSPFDAKRKPRSGTRLENTVGPQARLTQIEDFYSPALPQPPAKLSFCFRFLFFGPLLPSNSLLSSAATIRCTPQGHSPLSRPISQSEVQGNTPPKTDLHSPSSLPAPIVLTSTFPFGRESLLQRTLTPSLSCLPVEKSGR